MKTTDTSRLDAENLFKTAIYRGFSFRVNATGTRVYNPEMQPLRVFVYEAKNGQNKNCFNYKRKLYYMGRLVCLAFHPNPDGLPLAVHSNMDCLDDYYKNVLWGSYKDLTRHRIRHGKEGGQRMLSKGQVNQIKRSLESGATAQSLAAKYGTSHATITRIRKRFMKEKHGNRRYHTEVKMLVKHMLENGVSPKEISKHFNIRYETVWKWSKISAEALEGSACGHLKIKDVKLKNKNRKQLDNN